LLIFRAFHRDCAEQFVSHVRAPLWKARAASL
jgi:hypothetical protein